MHSVSKTRPYDFWEDYISHTYVINLERRPDRWQSMTDTFGEYGIGLQRINAVDGQKMQTEELRHTRAGGLGDEVEAGINGTNLNQKRGSAGCNKSHLKTLQQAQKDIHKDEDTRFIAILEDDSYALPELAPMVKSAITKLPDDAMMVYLTANHWVNRGMFPLNGGTGNDNIVKPTGASTTSALLIHPRFLPVLKDVVEANIAMKGDVVTGKGGMYPVDVVFMTLQTHLALGQRPKEKELNQLIDVFEASCKREQIQQPGIYAINPLPFGQIATHSDVEGRITDYAPALRTGQKLRTLEAEQVRELRGMMEELYRTEPDRQRNRVEVRETMTRFNNSDMSFDALKGKMADMVIRNRNAQKEAARGR